MYCCPTTISSASDNLDSDARDHEGHGKRHVAMSFNQIARPHAVLDTHSADLAHYHGNADLFLSEFTPFDVLRAKASQIFDERRRHGAHAKFHLGLRRISLCHQTPQDGSKHSLRRLRRAVR